MQRNNKMQIKTLKLNSDASLPAYAKAGDAGADLCSTHAVNLLPGEYKLVSTGIAVEIPRGYVGLIHPRSGLAAKHGITVLNTPGTVDAGYRGEIKVILINLSQEVYNISRGERIAQLVIQKVEHAFFEPVDELDSTERGNGGFGSTGKGGNWD
jgi:dUTP pyrophosphatase